MKCSEETHNDSRVVIPISIHTGVGTQSQPVIPCSPADSPEYKEYVRCRTAPRTDNHRLAMKSLRPVTIQDSRTYSFAPEVRVSNELSIRAAAVSGHVRVCRARPLAQRKTETSQFVAHQILGIGSRTSYAHES